MKTSEILDKAAAHIETHGWIQGAYADNRITNIGECRTCPRGSICLVLGQDPALTADFDWSDAHGYPEAERVAAEEAREAERAFARHIHDRIGYTPLKPCPELIEKWNDEPGRTAEQVVHELRVCAAAERQAGR